MDTEAALPQTLGEAHVLIRDLRTVAQALGGVAELEAQLGQNSSNSLRPLSSDPLAALAPAKRAPSGRKPGGQPGHASHQRPLQPPEQVDRLVEVWPERCRHCGSVLPLGPDLLAAARVVRS